MPLGGHIALAEKEPSPAPMAEQFRVTAIRIVFWIVLGLLAAASLWMSVVFMLALLAILVIVSALNHKGRETLIACRDALADGARQAISVGLACAVVGIVTESDIFRTMIEILQTATAPEMAL